MSKSFLAIRLNVPSSKALVVIYDCEKFACHCNKLLLSLVYKIEGNVIYRVVAVEMNDLGVEIEGFFYVDKI